MINKELLSKFARLASERSEVVAASLVFLVIIMMVIPINSTVLDFLIALNISLSLLLVVISVLLSSPLAFSSFPSLLLISTLFRLAITVSTARLILLDGFTGHIVEAFGEFVVGGNIAVGVIIFLIISVVNFIVVTKGSERVAEVAARFSLDGMPGKQMSIDSDLRAGLIDQKQAKQKRSTLERETQLFGAMDGALKFVKGDAIAGLVVVFVNLIGGLFIGVLQKGMTFGEAATRYSILSVGDGLVALIPSLMVSIAAGMVVTRVNKAEAGVSSVASDMVAELINNPKALGFAGVFAVAFGMIPGMPSLVFIGMSVLFGTIWFFRRNTLDVAMAGTVRSVDESVSDYDKQVEDEFSTRVISPLSVLINSSFQKEMRIRLENISRIARNKIVKEYGVVLPAIEFFYQDLGNEVDLSLCVSEVPVQALKYKTGKLFVLCTAAQLDRLGISHELYYEDARCINYLLVDQSQESNLKAQKIQYKSGDDVLADTLETLLMKNVRSFFNLQEMTKFLQRQESKNAELIKELQRSIQMAKIQDVLLRLLSENVSILNFETIAETLIEWCQKERDLVIVTEHVRIALKNQMSHQYAFKGQIYGFVISAELEDLIRSAVRQTATGSYLSIDDATTAEVAQKVKSTVTYPNDEGYMPVLVCSPDCRRYLRRFIENTIYWLPVLSFAEISPYVKMNMQSEIALDD